MGMWANVIQPCSTYYVLTWILTALIVIKLYIRRPDFDSIGLSILNSSAPTEGTIMFQDPPHALNYYLRFWIRRSRSLRPIYCRWIPWSRCRASEYWWIASSPDIYDGWHSCPAQILAGWSRRRSIFILVFHRIQLTSPLVPNSFHYKHPCATFPQSR